MAGVLALAVLGIALGLRLAGSTTQRTELGDIRLRVAPAPRGELDAFVPIADWGVRAYAFDGLFRVHAEPRAIDRAAVLRAAAGDGDVLQRAGDDADDAAEHALWRAAGFGVAGAAFLGAFVAFALMASGRVSRRSALVAWGAVIAASAGLVVSSLAVARSTFDPGAFERPRFYARGSELRQLLDSASKAEETAEQYRSTVTGSLQAFSSLLAEGRVGSETFGETTPGRRAVLASDLHANPLVLEPLRAFADDDRPVFLAGDFGHEGNEGEARLLAPALARLGPRVVAVSGNHDSRLLMRALARAGILVLTSEGRLQPDGDVSGGPLVEVDEMTVAAFSDPLEWRGSDVADPDRVFGFAQLPDGDRAEADAKADLVRWFDGLPARPDLVLVHQNGLAQELARTLSARGPQPPLVILTGHDHRQHVDRHGDIVIVDGGSLGAGGVLGATRERVALGELNFAAGDATLRSVDLIEVDPLNGAGRAERVIVEGARCAPDESECQLSAD